MSFFSACFPLRPYHVFGAFSLIQVLDPRTGPEVFTDPKTDNIGAIPQKPQEIMSYVH